MTDYEEVYADGQQPWNAANVYVMSLGQRLASCIDLATAFCSCRGRQKQGYYAETKLRTLGLLTLMRASKRFSQEEIDTIEQKIKMLPANYPQYDNHNHSIYEIPPDVGRLEAQLYYHILPDISKLFAKVDIMENLPEKIPADKLMRGR